MSESQPDFNSSKLGTKEYWDEEYTRELKAFSDIGDAGEIWFGEDCQNRMVKWVSEKSKLPTSSKVIDLGCGNGAMLIALREEDFTALTGVDYSEGAIQLAKKVAAKEGIEDINFKICDILSESSVARLTSDEVSSQFDLAIDKGTYDAICLRDTSDLEDRQRYVNHVHSLLADSGLLVITSCNWTKEQLILHFNRAFQLVNELQAPKFTFGGQTGQTVTTLIFKKKCLQSR